MVDGADRRRSECWIRGGRQALKVRFPKRQVFTQSEYDLRSEGEGAAQLFCLNRCRSVRHTRNNL